MKIERKPEWLRKKVNQAGQSEMRGLLGELRLNTVCQQALCPNISECFSCGQATFLILGRDCTRQCSFCNVEKSRIPLPPESDEPARVAQAVVRLGLKHVVVTSPTRDDLSDGGAAHYALTVAEIRKCSPNTAIELLVPDFGGELAAVDMVVEAAPDIIAHNLETVPRLYQVRSGADYERSLALLSHLSQVAPELPTKSGIMLGLGESEDEVLSVMADLRRAGCCYLSIGQYLAPSKRHQPVQEYVAPERFEALHKAGVRLGFRHVESGPYVRSSYHAAEYRKN